jgi:hypothetical protein
MPIGGKLMLKGGVPLKEGAVKKSKHKKKAKLAAAAADVDEDEQHRQLDEPQQQGGGGGAAPGKPSVQDKVSLLFWIHSSVLLLPGQTPAEPRPLQSAALS